MIVVFLGLLLVDGWLDGSLSQDLPDKPTQATLFTLLLVALAVPAQRELGLLVRQTGAELLYPVTLPATVLLATLPYWTQFSLSLYALQIFLLAIPLTLLALFWAQAIRFGTNGTVRNVSASFFSIVYLGIFPMFLVWIRVFWGVWVVLLFVSTIKCSDIGAYAFGRLFGRHKLCPGISPGKTWEGLGGAAVVAAVVSFGFSFFSGIMTPLQAVVFGAVFGVLGQAGDLVESMIKRDAAMKDSGAIIPGFGGILDVIDSPLATAPAAFIVFWFVLA